MVSTISAGGHPHQTRSTGEHDGFAARLRCGVDTADASIRFTECFGEHARWYGLVTERTKERWEFGVESMPEWQAHAPSTRPDPRRLVAWLRPSRLDQVREQAGRVGGCADYPSERVPAPEVVVDRARDRGTFGRLVPMQSEPRVQGVGDRPGLLLPQLSSTVGIEICGLALNLEPVSTEFPTASLEERISTRDAHRHSNATPTTHYRRTALILWFMYTPARTGGYLAVSPGATVFGSASTTAS